MSSVPSHLTLSYNIDRCISWLKGSGVEVDTGHWQGVTTAGKPDLITREVSPMIFTAQIPETQLELADQCQPNLPWAEDHFQERVSRVSSNPGKQYKNWPWWFQGQTDQSLTAGRGPTDPKFTHTYQERYWPKVAGEAQHSTTTNLGIRYEYGDLDDVINLLRREPYTRQAYLPIFFPEDTGAVHGGRIPCTLGYHFLLREDTFNHKTVLNIFYDIRSCDAVRHFRDDVYITCRLVQWMINQLRGIYEEFRLVTDDPPWGQGKEWENQPLWDNVTPGTLYFKANSFHVHAGDRHLL